MTSEISFLGGVKDSGFRGGQGGEETVRKGGRRRTRDREGDVRLGV